MDTTSIFKAVSGAVLIILVSLFITFIRKSIGVEVMLITALFVLALLSIYIGFRGQNKSELGFNRVTKELNGFSKKSDLVLENLRNTSKLNWIISDNELIFIETQKKKSKEIWIINPDPSNDTGDSPWTSAIKDNLNDGIKYIYIAPNRSTLPGAVNGLKTVFRGFMKQCKILAVTEEQYQNLPFEHLVVYDPLNTTDEIECYAEIIGEERGFWFRIPETKRNEIIGRLSHLVKEAKSLDRWRYN